MNDVIYTLLRKDNLIKGTSVFVGGKLLVRKESLESPH